VQNQIESEKRLIGVSEAARLVGLKRNLFYRILNSGELGGIVVKVPGCHTLIRRTALLRWAEGSPTAA